MTEWRWPKVAVEHDRKIFTLTKFILSSSFCHVNNPQLKNTFWGEHFDNFQIENEKSGSFLAAIAIKFFVDNFCQQFETHF